MSDWIGVDLDCTLAYYESGQGVKFVGTVIEPMKARVLRWIGEGKTVKIFTARVSMNEDAEAQRKMIQDWLEANGMPRLEVTCIKDTSMTELWDDRAVGVVKNVGVPK